MRHFSIFNLIFSKCGSFWAVHTVKAGDTLWKIAYHYGATVQKVKEANGRTSNMIYPGQKLYIPQAAISEADKELMARLVAAEAKGEPYAGR